NYDDNYYPHESLSFPCCDYCGGSHETIQCQPDNQNIEFSGSDQIQTPQYPDVNPPSPEINLKELAEYDQSTGMDLNDNEDHHVQTMSLLKTLLKKLLSQEPPQDSDIHQLIDECCEEVPEQQKENMEKTTLDLVKICHHKQFLCIHDSNELFQKLLKDLKELAEYDQSTEPPQDSDIHQLIDECCEEVPEQQKENMEKTTLDLVKICHHKQFLCIHVDVDDLIESALDSKLLSINSINSQQLENSLSMGYEHLSITPETESDEVMKSNATNLLPIPSECEVTLEDKRECDELVCDNHSDTFYDSKIYDDILVYDDNFEDIEYVEASLLNPEMVSVEEENVVQQEEEEVDLEDISQVQDVVLRKKLFCITRLISNIESLNDNSTPDCVFNSFESDNSLLDNFSPEFETFCDHTEETRSGNTTLANYSLPKYDSFCFEIEPDQERLINLVENDNSDSSNDLLLEEVDLFLSDNSIPPGIENVADDPEGDICFLEELLI
nr:hypothetical protein [Tanacetum cinerariifolium]